MKRILLSAVLLLACGAVQAQFNIRVYNMSEVLKAKPIDKVLFTAQYDLSFVGDTAHEDKHIDETMMLKVGSKSSLFYSYARFRMDSLIEMDKATGASQEIIQEHMKQGTSQVNYQIFKNYPEGKLTQLEPIAASNFRSEKNRDSCLGTASRHSNFPRLHLLQSDLPIPGAKLRSLVHSGNSAQRRSLETARTARPDPESLRQPAALHLRLHGIEKAGKEEAILFIGSEYEPISRKDLLRIHERFAADPIGYLKETPPVCRSSSKEKTDNRCTRRTRLTIR